MVSLLSLSLSCHGCEATAMGRSVSVGLCQCLTGEGEGAYSWSVVALCLVGHSAFLAAARV